MDSRTGDLYGSLDEAVKAGVPKDVLVALEGPAGAVARTSRAVRRLAREERRRVSMTSKRDHKRRAARRQMQRESRRRNR